MDASGGTVGQPAIAPGGMQPPPDTSRVGLVMGVTAPLFAVAIIVYIMRMITRVTPGLRLGWDDATITLGVVISHHLLPALRFFTKWHRSSLSRSLLSQ
jgi:hypothetical protein